MSTEPTQVKPKRKSKKPKALVVRGEVVSANSAELAERKPSLEDRDRMSKYIVLVSNPREDGSWRTKKDAAIEAGYSESTARNISATIEQRLGFSRRLQAYFDAHPEVDYRAAIASGMAKLLRDPTANPTAFVQASRYYADLNGEMAPKRVETASICLKGKLPERK